MVCLLPSKYYSEDPELASGECTITVDYAYPVRYSAVQLVPDIIRLVAAGIIFNCVMHGGGIGGFATQGFVATIEHLNNFSTNLSDILRKTTDDAMQFTVC